MAASCPCLSAGTLGWLKARRASADDGNFSGRVSGLTGQISTMTSRSKDCSRDCDQAKARRPWTIGGHAAKAPLIKRIGLPDANEAPAQNRRENRGPLVDENALRFGDRFWYGLRHLKWLAPWF